MSESLPQGWVSTSLGDLSLEKVVQGPPGDEPVHYIDISSIDRFTKRVGETKLVTVRDAPTRARQWVGRGDVLVSMTRPNLNAVAQIGSEVDGAVASTGFDVLRPRDVLPEWIYYRVRTNEFIADVCEDLQGVVYPAIRPHDVRRHSLPLPPLPEQRRIVEAIESYFSRLDDAVATLARVQRSLKRYRASVLKAAVEGRLVPTEAELARAEGRSYEPASILLERILAERRRRWEEVELAKMTAKGKVPTDYKWKAKYEEPLAIDAASLPRLPDGWVYYTIPMVVEPTNSGIKTGPFGSLLKKHEHRPSGVPVLGIENIEPMRFVPGSKIHISPEKAEQLASYDVTAGDVLVSRSGTVGQVCVAPDELGESRLSTNVMRVRLVSPRPLASFLTLALNGSPFVRGQVSELCKGTTRDFLNHSIISQLVLPIPPVAEQHRVLAEVGRQLSVADAMESEAVQDQSRLSQLRQSILKWAFDGRLVDQDPTDEPASALLDRIKAERLSARGAQDDASADNRNSKRPGRRKARTSNA